MSREMSQDNGKSAIAHSKLETEQVALLFEAMPLSILATLFNAGVLLAVEWNQTDHQSALTWLALIITITVARLLLTLFYRQYQAGKSSRSCWKRCFEAGAIISGAVWGSSALLLFPESSIAHQTFLAFIMAGISAGAVTTLSTSRISLFGFLAFALIPVTIRFFTIGSEVTTAMGIMMIVFMIMVLFSASRIYRNTSQNIELRIKSEEQEDIIQQKTIEQRAILDYAPVGIWLVGTDGRYRFVNKTFCGAVGVEEERFLSTTNLAELLGEEAATSCLASDQDCYEHDEPRTSYETLTFVDGLEHILEITKSKIVDQNGTVTGAIGIGIDITEKRESEERLRILSQAVEQAGESIIITDIHGIIEYVNPSFTRITGFEPEEALNKNPNILKSGKQSNEFYERLWQTISSGKIWHSSVIDRRKDGRLYPALMTVSPIYNDSGEITHYVGVQQDMTDQNLLEEQFRQAQKMEALGTLVGGIAHDFNNILTGISGNIALAKFQVEEGSDLESKLIIAEDLSYKAADMIKQLMVFSRKGLIEMKPFGLTSFISNITSLIRTSIPENIVFLCDAGPEELVINGDSTQIEQVLINLLNNARDAVADSNEPKISLAAHRFVADAAFIESHPETSARKFAHITISDNGTGISESDLEHIFEPFFTTKEVGLGTGLGLSMAYGAIQSHRGILEVESTPDAGTTFHIYLPVIAEKAIEAKPDAANPLSGNNELILVVDDNADIRSTLNRILTSLNYRVMEAVDGLEAVDQFIIKQNEIALIIMDVVMPKLGGVKAAERIMNIRPDIKVIFTTGYDRDDTLKNEMPSKEYSIIAKPFSVVRLSQAIRNQLDS